MVCTSYYGKMKAIRKADPSAVFVAVSGAVPEWYGRRPDERWMRSFAPKWQWWKEWKDKFGGREDSAESREWYADRYARTVLACRDGVKALAEIKALAGGGNAYLICFEKAGRFCHRRLLAEWLAETTGEPVPEFGDAPSAI